MYQVVIGTIPPILARTLTIPKNPRKPGATACRLGVRRSASTRSTKARAVPIGNTAELDPDRCCHNCAAMLDAA